jgi:hypothetical protein
MKNRFCFACTFPVAIAATLLCALTQSTQAQQTSRPALAGRSTNQTYTNIAGFGVAMEMTRSYYPTNAPVTVTVTVSNGTSRAAEWQPRDACDIAFGRLLVKKLPSGTSLACIVPSFAVGWSEGENRGLRPGTVSQDSVDLRAYFGIRDQGDYLVQLLFRLPDEKTGRTSRDSPLISVSPLQIRVVSGKQ